MAKNERLRARNRRVPAGALRHPILLQHRVQTPPDFDGVDAGFDFTTAVEQAGGITWASIETRSGRTTFDGVDSDRIVSHVVRFRTVEHISAETWIQLNDGTRLDIIQLNRLDERGVFMEALCEATGTNAKAVSGQ